VTEIKPLGPLNRPEGADAQISAAVAAFVRGSQFQAIVRRAYPDMFRRVPPGVVMPFMGPEDKVPKDCLLCDGREVSRALYPDLFAAIGTTYGTPSNPQVFRLPDLRGRSLFGLDNMGGVDAGVLSVSNALGGTGGAEKHQLTAAESGVGAHSHSMQPAGYHSHGGATGGGGSHNHSLLNQIVGAAGSTEGLQYATSKVFAGIGYTNTVGEHNHAIAPDGTHSHTIDSTSAGASQAHNNMPPYMLTNWIIQC
jgi:microcystin-dependent protein